MSVIGIRMMASPGPVLEVEGRRGTESSDFTGSATGTTSAADFEAGMEQAAAEAMGGEGPPLWEQRTIVEALSQRAHRSGADGPTGNPHPAGSDDWLRFGRETGIWFRINPQNFGAMDRLIGEWDHPILAGAPFKRQAWVAFVEVYAKQIARLSDLMSRAARQGASDAQLRALADAALEKGNVGEGKKSDFKDAWRDTGSDLRFGNIAGGGSMVFGNDKDHIFKVGGRHKMQAMGDRAVEAVEAQAREMGLDLYESDDRVAERVGAGLALYFQRHQLELAHLRSRDPEAWERLYERRRELVAEAREGDLEVVSDDDPVAAMEAASSR